MITNITIYWEPINVSGTVPGAFHVLSHYFNSFKLFAFVSIKRRDQETSLERWNATAYGWGMPYMCKVLGGMVMGDGARGRNAAGNK